MSTYVFYPGNNTNGVTRILCRRFWLRWNQDRIRCSRARLRTPRNGKRRQILNGISCSYPRLFREWIRISLPLAKDGHGCHSWLFRWCHGGFAFKAVLTVELGTCDVSYCRFVVWSEYFWCCDETAGCGGGATWTCSSMVWKFGYDGLVGGTLVEWRICNLDVLVFLWPILSWVESLGGICDCMRIFVWGWWQDNLQSALRLDGLRSSHPIEVPVKKADEINQMYFPSPPFFVMLI